MRETLAVFANCFQANGGRVIVRVTLANASRTLEYNSGGPGRRD